MFTQQGNTREIVHLDMDTFFVSVERLKNSRLKNKPVIIGGLSDRGVVSSCSYEARKFGVHSAMPMRTAKLLCNDAIIIRGDMEQYSYYSHMVTEIIAEQAPLYEKASIDEHYIDISGMERFFGALKWTRELRKNIIKHTGLPISFGLSANKTISKIATGEAKPNGELFIPHKTIIPFISPLSIKKIPMIGKKTYHILRSMGVSSIGTLRKIPPEMMENLLGKNGIVIWEKANGIDNTAVKPYREEKSISSETTFSSDTIDIYEIRRKLIGKVEKLAFQLREQKKLTSCITIKIRYANFDTHTLQKRVPYTSLDDVLIKTGLELFEKLYHRRMRIRLVGIRFSHLTGGYYQLNIFNDTSEHIKLYQAIDKIKRQFGKKSIQRAICLNN